MNYSEYQVADFATDDFFIQWVKNTTAANEAFWTGWLAQHPQKQEIIEEARLLVEMLSGDEDAMQDWELEEVWQNLNEERRNAEIPARNKARILPIKFWQQRGTLVAAAIGIFLLVASGIFFFLQDIPAMEYATRYGEKRTIQLPDSSVVVLNANSKLTVPAKWASSKPREVKLKGEAYFSVTHKLNQQQFIVHTADGLQVEVLGTEFNVSDRGSKRQVVLTSGKVRLHLAGTTKKQQVLMKPGELVTVTEKGDYTQKTINPELYTAWKDNKLIFYQTSLREIATMLEANYGYEVIMQDSSLANQRITAYLEAGSLNDILVTLSETLDIRITQQQQKIIMNSN